MAISPTGTKQKNTISPSAQGHDVQEDETPLAKAQGKGSDRFLPLSILLSAVMLCAVYAIVNLLFERYILFSPSSSAITVVFRMDRVAGTLSACTLQECRPLKEGP